MKRRFGALLRLLPFLLMALVLFRAQKAWLRTAFHLHDPTALYLGSHLLELVEVLVFAVAAAALGRCPVGRFGLPRRDALRSTFWQGAMSGMAALAGLMGLLVALGAERVGWPADPISAVLPGLGYGVLFFLVALREEALFRGYGQVALSEAIGFWPAALLTTLWFASAHTGNRGENALGLVSVALFGLLACLSLRRAGHLWWAVGFHAAWDWGQTYFFGVADSGHPVSPGHLLASAPVPAAPGWLSGGVVGPEGSVLCGVVFCIVAVAVWRRLGSPRHGGSALSPAAPGPAAPQ